MKVALITGGGSGIGRAAATELAKLGFACILTGRRRDAIDLAAGEISGAHAIAADVTDAASVDRLFADVSARFGRLDLLFNNAGTGMAPTPIADMDPADWRRVVDTNLTGVFLCTRAAMRMMRAQDPQGGRIINNGSISAHSPRPDAAAYTASKHAVSGLTKATALEGRRHGIACGQIDIGNAATVMTGQMASGVMQADGRIASEPTIPVDLVAQAVAQMAALPLGANIASLTIMPTTMPFIGRG